ncbi:MAG: sel1 repeat family protein, partial [Clostridiales bacterium]|nr:sel1 repeat family protein [Clostridiales bacterium]
MEINVNDRTGGKVRDKRVLVTSKYRINKTKLKRRLWFLGILALVAGFALFNGNIYTYLADREYKKQNYEEAVRLYEKVAGSNAKAQAQLAFMYENGQGVPIDLDKAIEFYTLAAEKGNARSMYNLAEFYDGYYGLPVDYKKALDLYAKSAEKGYEKALTGLGRLYLNGSGVDPDLKKAGELFREAAEKG